VRNDLIQHCPMWLFIQVSSREGKPSSYVIIRTALQIHRFVP
jgi:hypothetical protein